MWKRLFSGISQMKVLAMSAKNIVLSTNAKKKREERRKVIGLGDY
jgi:hypothetical protein